MIETRRAVASAQQRRHIAPRRWCQLKLSKQQLVGTRALTSGRYHVSFEDIRSLAHPVLRHRVLTNFHAQSEGMTSDTLIDRLLEAVPAPKSGM